MELQLNNKERFNPSALYFVDSYKVGHKRMMAEGTTKLYGTWIPRHLKHAPKGIEKIVSLIKKVI